LECIQERVESFRDFLECLQDVPETLQDVGGVDTGVAPNTDWSTGGSSAWLKPPPHVRVFGIIGSPIRAHAAPAGGQAEAAAVNKLGHSSDPDAAQRQRI